MRRYQVVTDQETAAGFRLAGVETITATDPQDAERIAKDLVAHPEAGIILINQRFHEKFSDAFHKKLERLGLPLVIPVPVSPTWWREERSEDYIYALIRRAIGYQMKIKRG